MIWISKPSDWVEIKPVFRAFQNIIVFLRIILCSWLWSITSPQQDVILKRNWLSHKGGQVILMSLHILIPDNRKKQYPRISFFFLYSVLKYLTDKVSISPWIGLGFANICRQVTSNGNFSWGVRSACGISCYVLTDLAGKLMTLTALFLPKLECTIQAALGNNDHSESRKVSWYPNVKTNQDALS